MRAHPLWVATAEGRPELKRMLDICDEANQQRGERGPNPRYASLVLSDLYILALHRAQPASAALLLERGVPVDTGISDTGIPALHVAVDGDSAALLRLVLAHGAHVNARDRVGTTALHRAVGLGRPARCARCSRSARARTRTTSGARRRCASGALHLAAALVSESAVKVLLEAPSADLSVPYHTELLLEGESMPWGMTPREYFECMARRRKQPTPWKTPSATELVRFDEEDSRVRRLFTRGVMGGDGDRRAHACRKVGRIYRGRPWCL